MSTPGQPSEASHTPRRQVLRFGLQIARFDYPGVGAQGLFETVAEVARSAQDAGFDSIWVQDHVLQAPVPGIGRHPQEPVLEAYTLLSALAAVTRTVRLGALVTAVTFRNPALLAKMVTSLDVISGGRAVLGLGAAWYEAEHSAYGIPFPAAGARLDRLEEALRTCRAMFGRDLPGRQTAARTDVPANVPGPVSPGGPPVLVGGGGERRTLRLVARYADACNVFGDVPTVRRKLAVLDEHCAREGRDPARITRTKTACLIIDPSRAEARRRYEQMAAGMGDYRNMLDGAVIAGDPGQVAEQVAEHLAAGLDGLVFYLPDTHRLDTVRLAGETLVKHFGRLE